VTQIQETITALKDRLVVLRETRVEAVAAAHRLADSLGEGKPGAPDDLQRIRAFGELLHEVNQSAPQADAIETLDDIEILIKSLEVASRDNEQSLANALERVSTLSEQHGGAAIKACRTLAIDLARRESLDTPENRQCAEGLRALIELNEASDPNRRDELEGVVVGTLPQACLPAAGLAAIGGLRFDTTPAVDGTDQELAIHLEETEVGINEEASATREREPQSLNIPTPDAEVKPLGELETETEQDPPDLDELDDEPFPAEDVCEAIEELLRQERFGLAHWLVIASGDDPGLGKALAALAYASAMQSPVGESAGRLRELAGDLDEQGVGGEKAARLIVLAAGLRATLLAPHSGAVSLLEAVAASFAQPPGLKEFVEAVVEAGRSGFSATGVTMQARSLATAEDDLVAVQTRAQEMLKHRTIKYQRASNVWRRWVAEDGLLGTLLTDVVRNRVEHLDKVHGRIFELRNAKVLERELDATDRALKAAGRQKPITDKARAKLIEGAEEALEIAAHWVDVSRRLEQVRQARESAAWQKSFLDKLRTVAQAGRAEIQSAWDEWSNGDGLIAAAADGTRAMMDEVLRLIIEGVSPEGSEGPVDEILGLELLRVDGLLVDKRLEPPSIPSMRSLLAVVNEDGWKVAFERRLDEANFGVAARIVEVLRRENPDDADALEAVRLERLEEERRHLMNRLAGANRKMEGARRQGRLPESDALSLSNELNELSLDETREDLDGLEDSISNFEDRLAAAENKGHEFARAKYLPRLAEDKNLQRHRERFERLLEAGEVSTLEELVLAVERGSDPPSEAAALFRQLTTFFPTIVDDPALSDLPGPDDLAQIAHDHAHLGKISFGDLKEEAVGEVELALKAWRRLSSSSQKATASDLSRVLGFVGLTVGHDLDLRVSMREPRSHLIHAQPLGKALAPAFGSEAKGVYRVLPMSRKATDDAIVGTLSQVPGDEPIVVLSPGSVIKSTTRRGIADQLRHSRSARPVALIDDAAFIYLASRGGLDLATTMRISLPFTAINPYTPFVAGSVPLEMFYGRHEELAEVISQTGTCFIYGGRRLGKSALLRAAERQFEADSAGRKAIYIDLKSSGIGEWRAAEEIVDVIIRSLIEANVMVRSAARSETQNFELVREQVRAWLDVDPGRRILLLLDECDSFLNADAEDNFKNVSQLKSLMEETDRLFKPVFAGLHQVSRFQQLPNQPLAHLGVQLPIGPLTPQRAYELITKPMEALGYRFEDGSGLPERILTATNYQPSLIQLFCSELIKHMLDKHARGPGTPPYLVTSQDIESVYQAPHVVEEMRARFELTISLDPRYRVIAYVVALEAREGGIDEGLAPPEIRAACEEYWPEGFAHTTSDVFRSLLEEMDRLGILFKRDGVFLMRSPNVLRMLGTGEQIEERLYDAAGELEVGQGFEATSFRDAMGGDGYHRRPLTHQQVHGMLERQARVHVIVGSQAAAVDDVYPCLKEMFGEEASTFNFVDYTGQDARRVAQPFRRAGQKKIRVGFYRAASGASGDVLDLVRSVEDKIFEGDGPAAAIFVIGNDAMNAWQTAVAPREGGSKDARAARFHLVELGRWTESGLRAWAQSQEVDLPFHEKHALTEIIRVTGGWPLLVDRVVSSYKPTRNWVKAIEDLEEWLQSPDGALTLCDAIGLGSDPTVKDAWDTLVELDEAVDRELFQELLESDPDNAAATSALLRSMQVLDFKEGRFTAEPVAARAWRIVGSCTSSDARG
jgi:AAA+ ATPase superfamily predicted ATPase